MTEEQKTKTTAEQIAEGMKQATDMVFSILGKLCQGLAETKIEPPLTAQQAFAAMALGLKMLAGEVSPDDLEKGDNEDEAIPKEDP